MLSWRSYDVSGQSVVREACSEGLDFAHCVGTPSRLRLFSPDFCRTDKVTGCEPHPNLRFAERLNEMRKPVWIRFVLVSGLTDDPGNIEKVAQFVAPMSNVNWVEVLSCHQMGAFKWKTLGLDLKVLARDQERCGFGA